MLERECRTVTEALDVLGFGRVQWLLLGYCGLAWLADAFETMILSFLGPSVRCFWDVGPAGESLLTSVVFVGMLAGVYSLGVAADHLGRRRGFLASAVLLGAAGLASAGAPTFGWLLVLRAVVGFALGGTPVAVTLFAEFCTSEGRGRWLLLMQSFWTLGTALQVLLTWAVLPGLGWRWLLALSALPLLVLLALYPLVPESPHWLVSKGRYAEAEAVLQRVAAINGHRPLLLRLSPGTGVSKRAAATAGWQVPASGSGGRARSRSPGPGSGWHPTAATSPGAQAPLLEGASAPGALQAARGGLHHHQGEHQLEQHSQHQLHQAAGGPLGGDSSLRASAAAEDRQHLGLLRQTAAAAFGAVFSRQLRRTTLLLYGIWFSNAITYYGLVLLTTALQTASKKEECTPQGAPNINATDFVSILVTTMAEAPGLLAAAALVDSRGRKWTLRAGLLLCSAALGSLVLDPPKLGQLMLLFVARGCIEGTYSALYIYTPELYPTAVRSFGLALCNGFSRFGGFLAPFATVYLVESGRSHTAELLLAGLCGGAALCAFLLPYETRGRDLQSTELQPERGRSTGSKQEAALTGSQGQSSDSAGGPAAAEGRSGGLHTVSVNTRESLDSEAELVPAHEQHDEDQRGRLLQTH